MQKYIVGLDIGSSSIKTAVAEIKKNGTLALLKVFKMPSAGIRHGMVDDLPEATKAVSQVLSEVKKNSKNAVKNIFLAASSQDFKVQTSKGIVAVSRADSEIYKDDIDRAIEASLAVKLPRNRMIVHAVTREFVVDDVSDIRDPLGMVGNRLEVNSVIIDAFSPAIKSLTQCVENAGGSISGLFFSPLATSRSVLSKNQKDLGVVLIDIGFGKTGMSVYEEGKLLHAAVFPVGSGNVTNDLAIGLKTSIMSAESVKLSLGSAIAKGAPTRELVDLRKFDPAAKGTVSRRFISEIIEIRLAEILEFVNNELKYVGKLGRLPAGTVLAGGGSKLPFLVDLANQELKLSAQVGVPSIPEFEISDPEMMAASEDPEWACVFGLILSAFDRKGDKEIRLTGGFRDIIRKIFGIFAP